MSIWIITTGNSDVQLTQEALDYWNEYHDEVDGDTDIKNFKEFSSAGNFTKDEMTGFYPIPARVLGIVYKGYIEDNILYENYIENEDIEKHLTFPLLNTFSQYFSDRPNEKPSIIIILLTDQKNIFTNEDGDLNEKARNIFSPFWQDTCTLKPILKEYFKRHEILSSIPIEFFTLSPSPQPKQGLDNWNETLEVVKSKFEELKNKLAEHSKYQPDKTTVYVSHQSGTPAISSAVQFVSLSQFKNVKFLSSNIFINDDIQPASEPQLVDISNYWRGIQIQKAKQLIISGFPGAALKIVQDVGGVSQTCIDDLEKMVNFFNLYSVGRDSKDDKDDLIPNATQRIVDGLDLINFFLKQKNYLQGITLLAATQETFLKLAILSEAGKLTEKYQNVPVSKFLRWNSEGLLLLSGSEIKAKTSVSIDIAAAKKDILKKLKYPEENGQLIEYFYAKSGELRFRTNKNSVMFKWIQNLNSYLKVDNHKFKNSLWENLIWSCNDSRGREEDLRNQFVHNLRGIGDDDAIKYLLGYPEKKEKESKNNPKDKDFQKFLNNYNEYIKNGNVKDAYENHVRKKFLHVMKEILKLDFQPGKLNKRLEEIAECLDKVDD